MARIPECIQNALKLPTTRVTLHQMATFGKHISQKSIENSHHFIAKEIPARLSRQYLTIQQSEITKLAVCPPLTQAYDSLATFTKDFNSTSANDLSNYLEKVSSDLGTNLNSIKHALNDWMDDKPHLLSKYNSPVNSLLDYLHGSTIGIRTIIAQHNTIVKQWNSGEKPNGFYGIVNPASSIEDIVHIAAEDAKNLCIEKNGEAPSVDVNIDNPAARICCVESHVHFMIFEILKNSMRAAVDTNMGLPIEITITTRQPDNIIIEIQDNGGGIPPEHKAKLFWYYFTTVEKMVPTYTYSGLFGSPFAGFGCGLPIARSYARYMGGDLSVDSVVGKDYAVTTAIIFFDKYGFNGDAVS